MFLLVAEEGNLTYSVPPRLVLFRLRKSIKKYITPDILWITNEERTDRLTGQIENVGLADESRW